MSIDNLPLKVQETLKKVAQIKGRDIEEIVSEFYAFKISFEQLCGEKGFDNDTCIRIAARSFVATILAKPMPKLYRVLVLGYTNPRTSKSSGRLMARVYGIVMDVDPPRPVVIVLLDNGDAVNDLDVMAIYKMRLPGQLADRLFIDSLNAILEKSLNVEIDKAEEVLRQYTEYKPFTLATIWKNLSRTDSETGYVDEWSWRGIRGFIVDYREGVREDGTKWAYYEIGDDSILGKEFDEEGRPLPKKIRAWVSPRLAKYDVKSEVLIYGHLVPPRDENGEPFMNALGVLPGEITFPRGV